MNKQQREKQHFSKAIAGLMSAMNNRPICGQWQSGDVKPCFGVIIVKVKNITMPAMAYVDANGDIYNTYDDQRIYKQEIECWCSVALNLGGAGDA